MNLPPVTGGLQGPPSQPTASAAADTQRPFVQFGAGGGSFPPADKYLTKDDQIMVTIVSSFAGPFILSTRILLPNGQIAIQRETITSAASRSLEQPRFNMPEGFLLTADLSATITGQPLRGQSWCRISIVRVVAPGTFIQLALTQGYVTLGASISWPATLQEYTSRGPGATIESTVSNPAAGAQWSLSVPGSAVWVPQLVCAVLTTSAAVANRIPRMVLFDGTQEIADIPVSVVIPASQTARLSWGAGGAVSAPSAALQCVGFAPNIRLVSGFSIISITTAMDAADQWSNVRVVAQEYNGPGA